MKKLCGVTLAGEAHARQALATFDRNQREVYRKGLAAVQKKRRELFPGSQSIAALNVHGTRRREQVIVSDTHHVNGGELAAPSLTVSRRHACTSAA